MNFHKQRMLNVVRALNEAKKPERFDMSSWGHRCGTPACALGHYAARLDLQKTFSLKWELFNSNPPLLIKGIDLSSWQEINMHICAHFGISDKERAELFYSDGCGNAQNIPEAVAYIEDFIKRKWPDQEVVLEPAYQKFKDTLVPA